MLGKVSECESLYQWTGEEYSFPSQKSTLAWEGELSPGQQQASDEVVRAIENNEELLVWAVCGAGKTEVVFRGLERAFSQGNRVLLATPRVDVVKELYPRFCESFPNINIAALYAAMLPVTPSSIFLPFSINKKRRLNRR